jgi:hypothetical protein
MNQHWLAWIPVAITALLMYLAKITNFGVTDYNKFMLFLLAWSAIIIGYYRFLAVRLGAGRQSGERP